jgi:hypothetical protein
MRKVGTFIITAVVAAFALLPALSLALPHTASAAANAKEQICGGLGGNSGGGNCTVSGQPSINNTIKRVVNIFSVIAGIAAVFMVIIGGFRYVTSGGDPGTVSSAKKTVLYALIGVVVVAMAQTLVWFVLTEAL